jgi:hypothetical protein
MTLTRTPLTRSESTRRCGPQFSGSVDKARAAAARMTDTDGLLRRVHTGCPCGHPHIRVLAPSSGKSAARREATPSPRSGN